MQGIYSGFFLFGHLVVVHFLLLLFCVCFGLVCVVVCWVFLIKFM